MGAYTPRSHDRPEFTQHNFQASGLPAQQDIPEEQPMFIQALIKGSQKVFIQEVFGHFTLHKGIHKNPIKSFGELMHGVGGIPDKDSVGQGQVKVGLLKADHFRVFLQDGGAIRRWRTTSGQDLHEGSPHSNKKYSFPPASRQPVGEERFFPGGLELAPYIIHT